MQTIYSTTTLSTPIGNLGIHIHADKLVSIDFLGAEPIQQQPSTGSLSQKICAELHAYFQHAQHRFNVPFELTGTAFQNKVWQALCQIPPGATLTYGELAKQLSTSPRAIGNACRANPIPIIVPCHRVVAQHSAGGFVGKSQGTMIEIKQWLLAHEKGV